jgi:hypothetical protein
MQIVSKMMPLLILCAFSAMLPSAARATDDPNDPAIIWNCYETLSPEEACSAYTDMYNEIRRVPTLMNDLRRVSPWQNRPDESSCRKKRLSTLDSRKYFTGLISAMGLGTSVYARSTVDFFKNQLIQALEVEHTASEMGMINQARCITDARVGTAPRALRTFGKTLKISRLASRVSGVALAAEIVLTPTNNSLGMSLDQAYALDPVRLLELPSAPKACKDWIDHYPHIRRAVLALETLYDQAVWERQAGDKLSCQADEDPTNYRNSKELANPVSEEPNSSTTGVLVSPALPPKK